MARKSVDLQTDPVGTPHSIATCCWCQGPLVVNQVEQLRCWTCARPECMLRQIRYALITTVKSKATAQSLGLPGVGRYCWHVPLPSQCAPYEWNASSKGYLLWGGRAGPGKSTGGRNWLYYRSLNVPGHRALLLRENDNQLRSNHLTFMRAEVARLGGVWHESEKIAYFGTGESQSVIFCGHMADMEAVTRYLGVEYAAIVADEASLYPVNPEGVTVLAELSTRARMSLKDRKGHPVPAVFMPVTNPGGPSAAWLKEMCIDQTPDYERSPQLRPVFDEVTGEQIRGYRSEQWAYLSASLKDNPYMREDYAQTDLAPLSGTRYKQLADGDWDCFAGMFFPEWNEQYHVRHTELVA